MDRDQIDRVIASGERVDVKLNPSVPVYWVYNHRLGLDPTA